MDISEENVGNVLVATIKGRLDSATSSTFAERLETLTASRKKLILDLSGVDFVTSAGLRAVLTIVKKMKFSGGALALCGVQPQVREILDITGLAPMMDIYPSRAEGLQALGA
jgi:stage II sporulation protein AA (anti-sigma F factor antagonist)